MSTVLVVDDKEMMRDSVGSTLRRAGFEVLTANDGESALETIASRRPDVIVTDLKMPGLSGVDLLERVKKIDDELPVVLMTAFGTIETAVRAMRLGAFDYITKPFEGDELIIAVKRADQHARLLRENAVLRASAPAEDAPSSPAGVGRMIGASPAMRRVREQVIAVSGSQGTVLICGESGAGKEVIARAIHETSPRAGKPFLAVNCAALNESLLESELFGHERGAFTGADRLRKGRFELADGGTLLLDEVSEISPSLQAKLLRVLQERTFERVGSSQPIGVDVRVIATSNRDLPRAVARGDFRQDLFFRLNVLPIHVPPLRDRIEDVRTLAGHFVERVCEREGRARPQFEEDAIELMERYDWPGNVRELQNICERAVVLATARGGSEPIGASMLQAWLAANAETVSQPPAPAFGVGSNGASEFGGPDGAGGGGQATMIEPKAERMTQPVEFVETADRTLEQIEREVIVQTLMRFNGHRQKTARTLGIGVRTLGLKLKKWKEMRLVAQSL